MTTTSPRMKQLVDWSAAVWGGLGAGLIFLLLTIFLSSFNFQLFIRFSASLLLGEGIMEKDTLGIGTLMIGLLIHFGLSVAFSLLIAFVIHRWGLLIGVVGGGLLGLLLYIINFYGLAQIFPWFAFLQNNPFAIFLHVIFGAVAGGIYEALEVEEFVPAN